MTDHRRTISRFLATMAALVMVIGSLSSVAASVGGAEPVARLAAQPVQETHHGATFYFDPGTDDLDRYDVIEGVRLGQDIIGLYLGMPSIPNLRIYVLATADEESDTTLASASGTEIRVYTGSETWQVVSPIERVQTLVHEMVHVYQNIMIETAVDPEPLWFAEGTAEAIGYQAIFSIGVTDQQEIYNLIGFLLQTDPIATPLSALEGFDSMDASAYPLAYIAVQYLLGSRGLSVAAIGEVYRAVAAGATFSDAIAQVFGVTLDQFYAEFEGWRPGISLGSELDDDFWGSEFPPAVSEVSLTQVPASVRPGGQLTVVGATAPNGSCLLDVSFGTGPVQRPAVANGAGEVFWLVSVPDGAAPGPVALQASCGGPAALASLTVAP